MSVLFLLLSPIMAQGPFVLPGSPMSRPQAPVAAPSKTAPKRRPNPPALPRPLSRLQECLKSVDANPADVITPTKAWLAQTKGAPQADPLQCLGAAYFAQGQWKESQEAFTAARDALLPSDTRRRAELGGMAGNAALVASDAKRALELLDIAVTDARAAENIQLTGEVAIDRARAFVALKRDEEAAKSLVEARTSSPTNPLAWLLSATLSRRMNKLPAAQAQISTAASLAPTDPEIGLEAGLIAMLAGNEAAARRSWQSVLNLAPQSDAATTARNYLQQLGPETQSNQPGR